MKKFDLAPGRVKAHTHDINLTCADLAKGFSAKNRKFPISAATQPSAGPVRVKCTSCE